MTLPLGYRYAALYAGIRKVAKNDLCLIVSDSPASAAAVFTQNKAAAAPVKLGQKNLAASKGIARAIITNAGNANCATRTGDKVANETVRALAKVLKVPANQILPASTGVIGVELDVTKITTNLPALVAALSPEKFDEAADAILTTDLTRKVATASLSVKGGIIHIAGMTKGSGMIQPLMATTLAYIVTDAVIAPTDLQKMLVKATDRSYNCMSVDGDTSTNDTVYVLANGASGIKLAGQDKALFSQALTHLMEDLARQIARDGEGAKKLITIEVAGTKSDKDALRIARQIANSPLVKTAIAGSDPNWGRIMMAAGNAGVNFELPQVDINFQGMAVCRKGVAVDFSEAELIKLLDEPDVLIQLQLRGPGKGQARFFTCDFTEGYIKINGSYRT